MGSTTTNTPHDALFKAGFETPEHAAALFRQVLPKPIVDAIDWSTLRREAGSFIDPTLAASHSDLLFSAQLVLDRRRHRAPRDMCLRVLGYMVRGWERYRKQHPGRPLPPIIPIVISHDPNGWTAPTSFHELFEPGLLDTIPDFAKFLPSFELRVEDLIEIDDRQLRRGQLTTFALLTLQLLRDARTPARVQACLPDVDRVGPTAPRHVQWPNGCRAGLSLHLAGRPRAALRGLSCDSSPGCSHRPRTSP